MKSQQQKRSDALAWWRTLSDAEKMDYSDKWRKSLPSGDHRKGWFMEMISTSTSVIQQIHEYITDTRV